ncbi:MAG TPA: energy transducer TonB [Thermoanaerobaculia bacterium]|nr:energy transducer TonB [Thermoanaerobaculia bacterium]
MTKRPIPAALGLTLALAAFAPSAGIAGRNDLIDTAKVKADWKYRIDAIEALLHDQTYSKAKKQAIRLREEMIDGVQSGPGAAAIFAIVTFQRAIAEAGLGEERDALWDLNVALSFNPKLQEIDRAAAYGTKVADLLERGSEKHEQEKDSVLMPSLGDVPKIGEVSRPEIISRTNPHYPPVLRRAKITGKVISEVIIGVEGDVSSPRILQGSGSASLDLAALEALRFWRFRPAQLNGSPVKVYYVLTINFQIGIVPSSD